MNGTFSQGWALPQDGRTVVVKTSGVKVGRQSITIVKRLGVELEVFVR